MNKDNRWLTLQYEPLSVDPAFRFATVPQAGAISSFIGTTRNTFEGKQVVRLEYEGYESMAYKEMNIICDEIYEKWPNICKIVIHHRLGSVPIQHMSILIVISSPHRKSSLHAVEYAIDTLKARVPIWKREIYHGDTRAWKENLEWKGGRRCMEIENIHDKTQ